MTDTESIPRRDFLKSAVAIGGTAALSACLERGGADVPTGPSDLSSYTRLVVSDIRSGDDLTVTVDAPPQTARHEGYETAFLNMPEMNLTL